MGHWEDGNWLDFDSAIPRFEFWRPRQFLAKRPSQVQQLKP